MKKKRKNSEQSEFEYTLQEASRDDYDKLMIAVNQVLWKKVGLNWDELPDNTSLWSHTRPNMTSKEIQLAAKEAANERLRESGYSI